MSYNPDTNYKEGYEAYPWEFTEDMWISPSWKQCLENFKKFGDKYWIHTGFLEAVDRFIYYASEFDADGLTEEDMVEYVDAVDDILRLYPEVWHKDLFFDVIKKGCKKKNGKVTKEDERVLDWFKEIFVPKFKRDVLFHFSHIVGGDISTVGLNYSKWSENATDYQKWCHGGDL